MDVIKNIIKDIKVELTEEFDLNFEREAFFSKPWTPKAPHGLKLSGDLRKSITSKVKGNSVVFTSQLPYAAIHNEGGVITVTAKMKKFFWAKYKNTGDSLYKALAFKKIGSKIIVPQRQFIGDSREVEKAIEDIIRENMDEHFKDVAIKIQRHLNVK